MAETQSMALRKGMPDPRIDAAEFKRRFQIAFEDDRFDQDRSSLDRLADIAWTNYLEGRKAPRTRRAGPHYADPEYQLSVDWIDANDRVRAAQDEFNDREAPTRILIINGSPRSEHTCPGEMSKTYRLVTAAADVLAQEPDLKHQLLDLSRLTSEYGRTIYPCKACFSTSPALCHWPCSCYPNYALGQSRDWMNEIYPMWVRAHGILIVTPTHWYQAPTVLKSMIDRLVCADGGNPDPTSTHGKDAEKAQALEAGWPYPRHLEGRVFAIFTHGDSAGAESLRRSLTDWLVDMHLEPAASHAVLDRYIGYYEPYSSSHAALDREEAMFQEIANATATLVEAARRRRSGETVAGAALQDPRPK